MVLMDPEEFRKKCKGMIPVQYCPYKQNGDLDLEGLKKNTAFLVDFAEKDAKDVVIMTNGSTTEFYANSLDEQKAVIKTVVDTVNGRIPVVAGASNAGTKETIKMVKYVQEAGADCAMVVIPYYHKPTKEGMFKHYKEISDSADIAIMVYNNPDVSGSLIDPFLMKRISEIENVVALKDNTPNAAEYAWKAALIDTNDMTLLAGCGELHYLGAASYGYKYQGFVSWIPNFAPQISYPIYEAVRERDFIKAQKALEKQMPLWRVLGKFMSKRENLSIIPSILQTNYMYMSVGKAAMDLAGLSGGQLRRPLEDLTPEEKEELRMIMIEAGVAI
jgi:4-hydroxy-tetrahydrodipicolinate synthase